MLRRFRRWWFGPLGALAPMGVAPMGHHLGYGTDGWGRYWLPDMVQGWIIGGWNAWACRHLGHAWTPEIDGVPMDAPLTRETCTGCGQGRTAPAPWRAVPTTDPHRWYLTREAAPTARADGRRSRAIR